MSCRDGILSATEAKQLVTSAQQEMLARKASLDEQRDRQEKALHEKLSQRKKQQLAELVRVQLHRICIAVRVKYS